MVLVELPVTFQDLKKMMDIFQKEDPAIANYEVEVEGGNLVVNPVRGDSSAPLEEKRSLSNDQ